MTFDAICLTLRTYILNHIVWYDLHTGSLDPKMLYMTFRKISFHSSEVHGLCCYLSDLENIYLESYSLIWPLYWVLRCYIWPWEHISWIICFVMTFTLGHKNLRCYIWPSGRFPFIHLKYMAFAAICLTLRTFILNHIVWYDLYTGS